MMLSKLSVTFPDPVNLGAARMRRNGKLEENYGENYSQQKDRQNPVANRPRLVELATLIIAFGD